MDELIRQLKAAGVLKSRFAEGAFRAIDRKRFVPSALRADAYADTPLPIGNGQTISQPYTVAFMLDLLDPRPGEKILEVGAGSGWQTALLAHIVGREEAGGAVWAVERIAALCRFALANLEPFGFLERGTVKFFCKDASVGLPEGAPYDKIIAAAAAVRDVPDAWRRELRVGGRIVAPVEDGVRLLIKRSDREWEETAFSGFAFVPLRSGVESRRSNGGRRETGRDTKPDRNILLWCAGLLVLGAITALFPVRASRPVEVDVAPGMGSRLIGEALKSHGLVRSKWAFITAATLTGRASGLKPGHYQFFGWVGIPEIIRTLVRGMNNELTITLPEGWDLQDVASYLERHAIARSNEWYAAVGTPDGWRTARRATPSGPLFPEFDFLADKPAGASLEGYLFPDTYRIYRGATSRDIAARMLQNFGAKLTPELRAEIRRQGKTVYEIVTMASLLEKEVARPADRKVVAGILWERIRLGMPLQVDASISYTTRSRRTPSAAELAVDSPYNTYLRRGLPAGPIANPGTDAILAAIRPQASPYLYYLSAPDGRTVFSRTLEEHRAARAHWL